MSKVQDLRKHREAIGNDLDSKRREHDKLRRELNGKEAQRDALKDKLKDKRKRDPESEKRIEELEREIAKHADNLRKLNERTIPVLEGEERALTRRIDQLKSRWDEVSEKLTKALTNRDSKVVVSAGSPHWGGGADILANEVQPVAQQYGAPLTSAKRAADHPLTIANPSSDHSALATTAAANDFGTFSGANLAHSIAKKLGISGYSTGNYNGYYIQRAGRTFRVQILWAVSGHYDHVHVGIRLV